MSYILDALRKSEQERQRGKVPDFYGAPEVASTESKKFNYWPVVTAVVVAINLGLLGYFFLKSPKQSTVAEVPVAVASQKPAVSTVEPVKPASVPTQPSPKVQEQSMAVKNSAKPTVSAPKPRVEPEPIAEPQPQTNQTPYTPAPQVAYMPQLEELSPGERQGIPDLTFSSHMYSSMPKFRSIIINGKRLKEGQFFNADLQVREITDTGVIMSHGSTLFQVDVLGRWAQ